jgi:hypothetical protein
MGGISLVSVTAGMCHPPTGFCLWGETSILTKSCNSFYVHHLSLSNLIAWTSYTCTANCPIFAFLMLIRQSTTKTLTPQQKKGELGHSRPTIHSHTLFFTSEEAGKRELAKFKFSAGVYTVHSHTHFANFHKIEVGAIIVNAYNISAFTIV